MHPDVCLNQQKKKKKNNNNKNIYIYIEVFPDLIDMKFPDRSSSSRKKHANKIEIDFNSLITQGLQRDRDKEAKNRGGLAIWQFWQ